MLVKATNTDGWILKLGHAIGTLFSAKPKSPSEYDLPISQRELDEAILLHMMCNISKTNSGSDWDEGLEYALWEEALEKEDEDGCALWLTAHRAKGWWIWENSLGKPVFISLKEWSSHYASWHRRWGGKID